ncbi:hypothetical protein BTR14_19940 [Rhizobium rhizosphaerae]|uniref:Uncharacterized protein n=1 Tax=Xaviernesmea rhizosphaerae TaxID=1672749 RepID=A0ABX3P807_9HYPH|nr:hypothetical protein [Xaviernesmea rhizosphaerae]OQP84228.1 hypothetical protein BTR14_19940 [Xaviernesmea rhizosphaerae]
MDKSRQIEGADADLRGQDPAEGARDIIDHELARSQGEGDDQTEKGASDKKSLEKDSDGKGNDTPHPAGPHARPDLTDKSKTPGAGTLAEDSPDTDPGAG